MLKQFDVAYFMASTDDLATNTRFAQANGADFPVLADPDGTTARAYGVLGLVGFANRWTYYIDRDGRISHIDKRVSSVRAGEQIAERLRELGVPAAGE